MAKLQAKDAGRDPLVVEREYVVDDDADPVNRGEKPDYDSNGLAVVAKQNDARGGGGDIEVEDVASSVLDTD